MPPFAECDRGKADALNAFFYLSLQYQNGCPQGTQLPELEVGGWEMSEAPITQEEIVSDLLCKLHTLLCGLRTAA